MLRRAARFTLAALLWLTVLLCLAAVIVPQFLDRIYYRGGVSDHFDGARFFNPDGQDTLRPPGSGRGGRAGFLWRQTTGSDDRPEWPESVAVAQATPPARVEGDAMLATWVGHATVLVQTGGLNILTDPVWSETAGPFGIGPRRATRPGIAFDRLPRIDLVLVSHNHYDHMDLATLKRLWDRDRPTIVTSLGNDAILQDAGIPDRNRVTDCFSCTGVDALDWGGWTFVYGPGHAEWEKTRPGDPPAAQVHVTRNHHWGSRWFSDRNRALWSSFVVKLPSGGNLFFAGDTGFGDGRWPAEAARLGPVRLAIIPIGAFRFSPGEMGTGSHIGPNEAVKVFDRLGASTALPIHWGTFRLSYEGYWTPPRLLDVVLRCSGGDAGRFRAHSIGRSFAVPAYTAPTKRPDEARIAECSRTPAANALQ